MPRILLHRFGLLVALFLAAFLGGPRAAHAAEANANCTNFVTALPTIIMTPGTWCLSGNLKLPYDSGTAVSVSSDDVVLDCNGFVIENKQSEATTNWGISAGGNGFTLRNCTVRGFWLGLVVGEDVDGTRLIEDNLFLDNTLVGIYLNSRGHSTLRRNRVLRTGGSTQSHLMMGNGPSGVITIGPVDLLDNTIAGVVAAPGTGFDANGIIMGSYGNEAASVRRNRIRGLIADGSGKATAINTSTAGPQGSFFVMLRGNDLVGDAAADSVGMSCVMNNGRARGNVIKGFASAFAYACTDVGGNDITP